MRSRTWRAVLVLALAVGATLLGASIVGAQREEVTIRLERFYDNACRCYKLRFSGTIASGAANEYVAVLQQKCGTGSATAIAGATTKQGGAWEADPVNGTRPESDSSTYRARWNGRLSEPLVFRGELALWLTELAGGRYRVNVSTASAPQNMNGRRVELQRLVAGRWTVASRARLSGRGTTFTAIVTARARNQSFRIFVPRRSAAPCYVATTSQAFVAGRPAEPGSAAVIDRTLSCAAAIRGGLRMVEVRAFAGSEQPPLPRSAETGLHTNWTPDGTLVSGSTGGIQLNPRRCTAVSARVPLVTQGLRGGTATSAGVEYKCEATRSVLVRIRAVFHVPTKLELDQAFGYPSLQARGEVREVQLAVRSQSGRALAFATIAAGKARLLAAPSCVEDEP
jgi:hypothetical protein